MDRYRFLLLALPFLVLGVAACTDTAELEERIVALEATVVALQADTTEPLTTSATLVTSISSDAPPSTDGCSPSHVGNPTGSSTHRIVYLVGGAGGVVGYVCVEPDSECAQQAEIGLPLPGACSKAPR